VYVLVRHVEGRAQRERAGAGRASGSSKQLPK
jgi:hypothetical protein